VHEGDELALFGLVARVVDHEFDESEGVHAGLEKLVSLDVVERLAGCVCFGLIYEYLFGFMNIY
jgi:hypothetical protein